MRNFYMMERLLEDMNTLQEALAHPLYTSHYVGRKYKVDNDGGWTLAYYPLFECGKTNEPFDEPRALMEKPKRFKGSWGTDFREMPLRYISPEND